MAAVSSCLIGPRTITARAPFMIWIDSANSSMSSCSVDSGITEEMYQELTWLIDDAKPLTRPLTGLAISLESTGTAFIGASVSEGDELSVYPPTQRDIDVSGVYRVGGREHHIDTMDIYS